jgi:hypothetical protein
VKTQIHAREHERHIKAQAEQKGQTRMERHSATGHTHHEEPKKGGAGGKGVWGTWRDDL